MRHSKRFGVAAFVLAIIAVTGYTLGKDDAAKRDAVNDKARSQELKAKLEERMVDLDRVGQTHMIGSPEYKAEAAKSKDLYAEWHALNRKHPEWNMGRSYASDRTADDVASGATGEAGGE